MTAPWRAVGPFVLLTICLSGIFWVLINATQTVNAAYIFGLMWMPAVAAILTCRILGRPLRTLGLGTWNGRYVLIGYLIPIAYCLVASLGIWLFAFGGFPNTEFVRQTAEAFGLSGASDWVVIVMFVVLTGTTGMLSGVAAATGEEIGWRGLLVPELAKVLPFTGVALGFRSDLGVVALSDHRARLPRCRPAPVVLAADVHLRRGRDQLRAGLASAEDRQSVAAHLSIRQSQPLDAVDLHPVDQRPGVHEVDRRRPRSGIRGRGRRCGRRFLAQAWLATGETGCAGASLGARGK